MNSNKYYLKLIKEILTNKYIKNYKEKSRKRITLQTNKIRI